jgi:membrane glycosyltransferase
VPSALVGSRAQWTSPSREDTEIGWPAGVRRHAGTTLLGLLWGAAVYAVAPSFLAWLLPVLVPLAVSIPTTVWSSRTSLGRRLRRARVFAIPEETRPPLELRLMRRYLSGARRPIRFADALVDPHVNAVACAAAAPRAGGPEVVSARRRLVDAALGDPAALGRRDRLRLLDDPLALAEVHAALRASPEARARWRAEQAPADPDGPSGALAVASR